ncbi:hypothetical protein NPIL_14691 [Nephila pilipes]|uniref:Mos1 transposase HTH domain-containing protein n=1 Tax=Nephila pilipes TaxID=299642 RepID=A0A8X6UFD1_NEPPI|nr:hypothetical protein NPIL_14691 [Nephila pilipes]
MFKEIMIREPVLTETLPTMTSSDRDYRVACSNNGPCVGCASSKPCFNDLSEFQDPTFQGPLLLKKFCVALKKMDTEIVAMVREVYGDDTMSKRRVYHCLRMFKEDEDHSGRP